MSRSARRPPAADLPTPADERTSPVDRLLTRRREEAGTAHRLSERAMQAQRSLEGYLQAGNRPRWMERLAEIEHGTSAARRRVERAHRALREACGDDAEAFARRWHAAAHAFSFADVNELIRQHNEWFPIERQLPVDLRTGDYVRVNGRSYRRRELDAAWVLEQFPAAAGD